MGRALKPPPQLGHTFCSELTQSAQNVHSNEQISASVDWGGRSAPQFSQQGRSSSMAMASRSQFYRLGGRKKKGGRQGPPDEFAVTGRRIAHPRTEPIERAHLLPGR